MSNVDKVQSGKLVVPYNKRLLFMAYAKQITVGPYNENADQTGWLDLVGSDRTYVFFCFFFLFLFVCELG